MRYLFFVICLLYVIFSSLFAAEPKNIALNKDYTLVPEPEYRFTEDPLDYKQLTDGVKDKSLWYEQYRDKTVGWSSESIVDITIDLEEIQNVGTVKLFTVGGGRAQVEYPEYVLFLVSKDGVNYHLKGFVSPLLEGWHFGEYKSSLNRVSKAISCRLNSRCRYIKLLIRPFATMFFSDEIEVFAAKEKLSDTNGTVLTKSLAIEFAERLMQLNRNKSNLQNNINKSGLKLEELKMKLSGFEKRLKELRLDAIDSGKLNALEKLFGIIRAEYLNKLYGTEWYCVNSDYLDLLKYEDLPEGPKAGLKLDFYCWQGERSIKAFNIVNSTEKIMEYNIKISPIKNKEDYIPSEAFIVPRRGVYVFSKSTGFFVDPMVLQGGKPFQVKPGEVVQISLEFNSKNLQSGAYKSAVLVESNTKGTKENQLLPINIHIPDKVFPSELEFMNCCWDFFTRGNGFTKRVPSHAISDLERHLVNVTIINHSNIFETNRNAANPFARVQVSQSLMRELRRRKYADFVLLFLCFGERRQKMFGEDFLSKQWNYRFGYFIKKLVSEMQINGFSYDNFAIYPYDEKLDDDFIGVAEAVKNADSKVNVYCNSVGEGDADIEKAKDLVDIWCFPLGTAVKHPDWLSLAEENSKSVWSYGAPSKKSFAFRGESRNITSSRLFYRTAPIKSEALGLKGAGFWTYVYETDESSFNNITTRGHGIVYDGRNVPEDAIYEPIVPSKRWQQWREAVEDAVALKGHQNLLEEFMNKPEEEITSEYITNLRKRADKN
ncbi:hypothetical protein [Sedimentisphaera salicampi]|uniref:hypothetical protein n=1 Tax=Sedimentisphaera salicampi TaxID=1941349 RepID=UPI000B9D3DBF|nr:hypothetical protein [Sedimentisphaera salicampi]OXU15573.1 hypothetical protein SMSP1_00655 [Sedimentisphaera salicampi]